jgi:superfamily II DNA/RNA helicase
MWATREEERPNLSGTSPGPTRELANQVRKDFRDSNKMLSLAWFYGGTPYSGQID